MTETKSGVTASESQDTEMSSSGFNGQGMHLNRIKQALKTAGAELPLLMREQRRNVLMEITSFLHLFCSS